MPRRPTVAAFVLRTIPFLVPLSACTTSNEVPDESGEQKNLPPLIFGSSRLVARGHYHSLLVDPWDDRVPIVITFDDTNGLSTLAMRPIDGRLGCNAGGAIAATLFDRLPNRVQLVAMLSETTEGQVLKFVDHNCEPYGSPIIAADLPSMLFTDPPAYLVKTGKITDPMRLLAVDPWNGTSSVLADNVTWYAVSSNGNSTVRMFDGGHYKVIDGSQRQQCDIGTLVSEIVYLGDAAGPFFLIDSGVLRRYQSILDTAPLQIAENVCGLKKDSSGNLYFFSPCDSRQLQRYRLDDGQITPLDSGVDAFVDARRKGVTDDAYVLYTKPNARGSVDLWLYSPDAIPSLVVNGFNRLYAWSTPPLFSIVALTDSDADRAQLVRGDGTGTTLLLDSVSLGFSQGVLANFNPTTSIGDLYTVPTVANSPKLVAQGVPYVENTNAIVTSTNRATVDYGAVVIANASAGIGDLQLVRYPNESSPGPVNPVTLASGSPVGRARFFGGMSAVAYLENWTGGLSDGRGSLSVRELTQGVTTNISPGVREFKETKWPSESILYTVAEGDDAGIWIANAE